MKKDELAVALHGRGYNCAQSVLMSMSDHTGMSDAASSAIGTGFGGGAGCRELCGALSGAFMATGARLGADRRPQVLAIDRELTNAFRERFGAVRCAELKAAGVPCDELIAFAAARIEEALSALSE
ncbi:MAG: C-GCAxxG-C-C family protein [Oscillospiraceae bacterium]|nr:C-GCAxxG-C-C family protein [Oscillospiraceae bacterium]